MSQDLSNFEQAEYLDAPVPSAIEPSGADNAIFVRAIVFGLVGAVAGAIVYAGFIGITNIQIGYLSIGVAYLVAKAMMMGSGGQGGIRFQISAIVLTCCAVAAGNAMLLWWEIHKTGPVAISLNNLFTFMRFGFSEPFLELKDSPGNALLGFFILFIGLRAAWRMTSGVPGSVRHPFSR